ncbi:MAG TPA: zf-HC2 domain-containing protein [Vicinamibacterales bacterium]|nr:zf-HC2 domain-containing protein [Vicinamibacterales bacterium]
MTHSEAVQISAAERYLLEELSELDRHAFEGHYFECADCAEDVRTGAMMREGVSTGLLVRTNVQPISSGRKTSRLSSRFLQPAVALPWAAAAMFAIVAGYQTVRQSSLPPQISTQALATITLRPDSRGADPVVTLPATGSVVTFALDVDSSDSLTYDLRTMEGQSVASGRADAPAPGAPLLLLVPVWTLSPNEHYILSVRRGADGPLVNEFRFVTSR